MLYVLVLISFCIQYKTKMKKTLRHNDSMIVLHKHDAQGKKKKPHAVGLCCFAWGSFPHLNLHVLQYAKARHRVYLPCKKEALLCACRRFRWCLLTCFSALLAEVLAYAINQQMASMIRHSLYGAVPLFSALRIVLMQELGKFNIAFMGQSPP